MKQDEVLNLARQADGQVTMWVNHSTIQKTTTFTFESPIDYYVSGDDPEMYHIKFLEKFAKLVAAKEREVCGEAAMKAAEKAIDFAIKLEREDCAKVCEEAGTVEQWDGLSEAADRIRARGEA